MHKKTYARPGIVAVLTFAIAGLTKAPAHGEGPLAGGGGGPESEESATSAVDRFFEAYARGDVDGMLSVYAPDAVFRDVAQRHDLRGAEALREFLNGIVAVHLSMGTREIRRVASGNDVIVEYLYTGTLSGAALREVTGKEECQDTDYEIPVTSWFEIRDGRIARQTDYIDLATFADVKARASGQTPASSGASAGHRR